ncbi:hypothetical protein Tco_0856399 [Tanacetum coccineum]|uniref:Uncharacterized protein n=1 Tax=Tanacetum coccineum TaxID=301880 RepID=A0ABQ5B6N6_9ASTR
MSAHDDFSLHDDEELSLHDDASLAGSQPASNKGDAPAKPPQIITTNTLSNIKCSLQKDDYDTWAMEMEHYLEYIDNEVWKVIQNGNSKKRVTKGKDGVYRVLPPTTQEEQVADEKERKARTLLLMAVPKDHLRRFHGMDDAKEIWAAIKTRFGGNANSKKMQKAVLKQQFEAFTISSKESLEKGYDRFQKLLSQLDALGASVSDEDANHKFLRSLPPCVIDNIQKTSSSSLASDNVAFISQAKVSSSKHKPSHSSGSYSSYTTSSSKATPTATPGLADEVIHSFLATNADDVDLIHEDLDQIDDLDLEEMDINWQIAMTTIKIKKFTTRKTSPINWVEQTTDEELNHALIGFPQFKQVEYKSVLTSYGDYTPREQEDIDDSLYEYGKHGPQPKSPSPNSNPTVYLILSNNDSDGEQGRPISDPFCPVQPPNNLLLSRVTISTANDQPQVPEPQQTVDPSCPQAADPALKAKGPKDETTKKNPFSICMQDHPLKHMEHIEPPKVGSCYILEELKEVSVVKICDKKLNVLFTEKECFVVSSDFKMPDENQVLLKVPRQHNMYTFDMKTVDSSKGYTFKINPGSIS